MDERAERIRSRTRLRTVTRLSFAAVLILLVDFKKGFQRRRRSKTMLLALPLNDPKIFNEATKPLLAGS
jgi:hypothetical protein